MNKQNKQWLKVSGAAFCALLLVFSINSVQSERRLQALLAAPPHPSAPNYDEQKLAGRNQRARQLYALWMERGKHDVATEVVPFLQDENADVRRSAVRVLGRLESAKGEAALKQLLKTEPKREGGYVPQHTIKLALGRIQARELKGKEKVEAVSKSIGLSFDEVARLSQKMQGRRLMAGTIGDETVNDMVDLLYDMAKQGEKIEDFTKHLVLNPAQKVKLQGASLPTEQEIKIILAYLSNLDVVRGADEKLGRHLIGLGPRATNLLIQHISQMKTRQSDFGRRGYVTLFRAASLTGDARVSSLLKQLEGKNDVMHYYAMQSRLAVEQGPKSPIYPPLP